MKSEVQSIPIHCDKTQKQLGYDRAWVVIIDGSVICITGDDHEGLYPDKESADKALADILNESEE